MKVFGLALALLLSTAGLATADCGCEITGQCTCTPGTCQCPACLECSHKDAVHVDEGGWTCADKDGWKCHPKSGWWHQSSTGWWYAAGYYYPPAGQVYQPVRQFVPAFRPMFGGGRGGC